MRQIAKHRVPSIMMGWLIAASFSLAYHGAAHEDEAQAAIGDTARGERVYKQCTGCHSIEKNRIGPRHRNVYGRVAGSLDDYAYSHGLGAADFVWNDETLDEWLSGPATMVPGARMRFRLSDRQDRADVIAYLREVASSPPTPARE